MAEDAARSRLGRGLAALIGDVGTESSAERPRGQRRVATTSLRPNARNPRRSFSEEELDELTASLRERGMIQPIVARPVRGAPDAFEIIAGERRWRAAQRAGLHEVPVVILEATDEESLQLAIIENVQRSDLNPLEEAEGYRALMEDYSHTQDDIAKMVGKSRSHVANTLRLLKLPPSIRAYIFKGKLDAGHARMLIGQPNAEKLAEEIVARGLNVRQVEEIARQEIRPQRQVSFPQPLGGKKRRHAGAGKALVGRTRPGRQYRCARRKRRRQYPLPQSRPARRSGAALGKKAALKDAEVLSLFLLRLLLRENRVPVLLVGGTDRLLAFASAVA